MPLKICYPAIENQAWQIVTGCDPKNTRWSYHNGGSWPLLLRLLVVTGCDPKNTRWSYHNGASWPVLLWLLVAVSVKLGHPHIGRNTMELMERRLAKDDFPEYYDGRAGVGKQARKFQTWSMAGYLVAKMLLDDPTNLRAVCLKEEEAPIQEPVLKRK